MSNHVRSLEIPFANGSGNRLALEFTREVDRWQHTWSCWIGDRNVQLMTSVEGSAEEPFPSSPPVQEIHNHPTSLPNGLDGGAILGVGMAGKGHWSVSHSIELCDEVGEENLAIRSDLACLSKIRDPGTTIWLGSTYRVAAGWEMERVNESEVYFRIQDTTVRCAAGPSTHFLIGKNLDGVSTLTMKPISISDQPNLATRWMFDLGSTLG